ncbi:radical SAM protein [Xanthobacter autotrophicus]|uniref:radical SAM protein n=1 Tax=Xanthobacter autotrophicus TaxID=280 RepID=UPI0024A68CB0|nr:radical SAM protein [Xanthobacter autotrophicus]MDI4657926.1 radical SAM protein [Xanthobacter autotrophicus]
MHYDIEADWQLLNTCNYRCDYCFFPGEVLGEKTVRYGAPDEWADAFSATGLTWLLHLTGGEPSAYPGFVDLCAALTRRHFISLNSNLTQTSLADFARRIDPARVSVINAGLHPDERARRRGLEVFNRNLGLLHDAGFSIFVSVVATPQVLAAADEVARLLAVPGLVPVPKLLRGTYRGRHYPDAYEAGEREVFRAMSRKARSAYGDWRAQRSEPPTIDPFDDDSFLSGTPTFRGKACTAGSRFVRIEPQGDVFRCGSDTALQGNILARTFVPHVGPSPCNSGYCFYFCRKYTDVKYTGPAVSIPGPTLASLVPPHFMKRVSTALQRVLRR